MKKPKKQQKQHQLRWDWRCDKHGADEAMIQVLQGAAEMRQLMV